MPTDNPNFGQAPVPDFDRIHRATEPRLRGPVPALNVPIENANQTLDRVVFTMNRGGSNARNPLLAGLGTRMEFHIGLRDQVKAFWMFRDRANLGNNLKGQLINLGPGVLAFDHVFGSGLSQAGNKDVGAKKNFFRLQSKGGAIDKEFWVKEYEADVVACNGQNALDLDTLEPVIIEIALADAGEDGWIDVAIDFFVSWNDEFQKMHNGGNPYLNPGFLKAYGGAAFVSFFDTDPGEEGEGEQCNPVTQAVIKDQHTIQIQATEGEKDITVRFRAKEDSLYFVDVDIKFLVVGSDVETPICNPPQVDDNWNIYIPPVPPPPPPWNGSPPKDPPYTPDTPSTPVDNPTDPPPTITGLPPTPAPTQPVGGIPARGVITLNGQKPAGGTSILVQLLRWTAVVDNYYKNGARMTLVSTKYYNPAVTDIEQDAPLGDPYEAQKKYTICVDFDQDTTDNVCFYTASLVYTNDEGITKQGQERLIAGPKWYLMGALYNNMAPGYGPGSCGGSGFPSIADNGSCPA